MSAQRFLALGRLSLGVLALGTSVYAQVPTEAAAPPVAPAAAIEAAAQQATAVLSTADKALLGGPMEVNGEVISVTAIKRHLCLGTLGTPHIMNLKLKAYMDEEIGRRKLAGEDVSLWQVDDGDIDAAIQEAKDNLKKEFPGQDVKLEDVLPQKETDIREQIRQTQRFDKMFLPDNPYEFPEITVMALNEGGQGTQLLTQLKDGWDQRMKMQEAGEDTTDDAQSKSFLTMLLRQLVIKYLDDNAVVEAPENGLADHMALRVNGQPILVETIWDIIKSQVSAQDVEQTRNWLVATTIARQALEKQKVWMSEEEFKAAYGAHSDPYKDSPFSVEMVATQFKKFPSVNDYRMYFRIAESFKKTILPSMTDAVLTEHGRQRTNDIVGLARVDVDVILCSAYDFKTKTWNENGWAMAEREALEVATALRDGTKTFDQCLDEYSDFYDPPIAESQRAQVQANQLFNKGRFKGLSRNELLTKTYESEYSIFLNGNAIADEIFFNQEVGQLKGPWKGPYGWYIARLNKRTPGGRTLTPAEENQRVLLEQEYVAQRLNEFIQDQYESAVIKSL